MKTRRASPARRRHRDGGALAFTAEAWRAFSLQITAADSP
jgi:hypothetical protein